jgi:RNA polymerase sigma-70 factor (TIGR02957 family)
MSHDIDLPDEYEALRGLSFSIAYRMLGSAADAENVVQEASVRLLHVLSAGEEIESPRAFTATVSTRLAIDQLRSARVRRESYVGEWLPEPLVAGAEPAPGRHLETADSLSMAFLLLLEVLSPVERAVFLLREVFDYPYDQIAAVVGRSEPNCRQILHRARERIDAGRPRFEASRARREELAGRFFAAWEEGDLDGLVELLADDVAFHGDGGGKATAIPRPLYGRDRVGRFVLNLARTGRRMGVRVRRVEVNAQPGAIVLDPGGRLINVVALDIAEGRIQTLRSIVNPDKLRHLGLPLSDLARPRRT